MEVALVYLPLADKGIVRGCILQELHSLLKWVTGTGRQRKMKRKRMKEVNLS